MAVTTTQVQQLYLAYFGRPAEQAGLTYWTSQADATVTQISAAFAQSPEYTGVYGSLTRAQTIDTLYQNLFGRTAANNELNYWLNSTDVSISNLALALVNGATGTDRVLLDSKAQYAASVTSTAGSSATSIDVANTFKAAGTDVVINGTAYTSLSAYQLSGSATNPVSASTYYTAAAVAQNAATNPVFVATSATVANGGLGNGQTVIATNQDVGFGSKTAGTITLNAVNADAAFALTGADATSLTVQGSVAASVAANPTANPAVVASQVDLTFTAAAATTQFNTLNLSLSSAGTTDATKLVGVDVTALTELTAINGSGSSAGLVITGTGASANLASITTGSGADNITVAPTATNAVALTVDAGAGNDTITATGGNNATLTLNGGAGNDTFAVTTTAAGTLGNVVVNGGAGNDIVNLTAVGVTATTGSHNVIISLGDGNDVVNVTTANLTNLNGTFTTTNATEITAANAAIQADLVKITDFNGSQDKLNVVGSGFVALDNTQVGQVAGAATLAEALTTVAGFTSTNFTSFVYGGNTYVYVDAGAGNTVNTNDGLIELTGYTGGLNAANFATA